MLISQIINEEKVNMKVILVLINSDSRTLLLFKFINLFQARIKKNSLKITEVATKVMIFILNRIFQNTVKLLDPT